MMNETLALVILWAVGFGMTLLLAFSAVGWLFFDTETGERPDDAAVARRRGTKGFTTSYAEYDEDDNWIDAEMAKGHGRTRWRRLTTWWNSAPADE